MNTSMNPDSMSHEEAAKNQVAEQFALGELAPADRKRFEAHFFDCEECFENARMASEFLQHAKQVLDPQPEKSLLARFAADLWRPATCVMTSLFLSVGGLAVYQQVRIAQLQAPAQVWRAYLTEQTRSPGNEKEISVPPGVRLELEAGFLQRDEFKSYRFLILSEPDKRVKYTVPLHLQEDDASGVVILPPEVLPEGTYSVLIQGQQRNGEWKAVELGKKEAGGVFHIRAHGS
jgi:hypothetical protein